MNDYTYELKNRHERLETYEWDNVWWEQANTKDVPRILYIGGSISCGIRRIATEIADGELFFDGFGTSKALDNPYFAESIRLFAKQEGDRCAILFNNGLHGYHLDDETEYAHYYEKMLKFLLDEFAPTPIFVVLSNYVTDREDDKRVQKRNKVATDLANKYNLPVIDFYTLTKSHAYMISPDGVHLIKDGYRLLAESLVNIIKEKLSTQNG